MELCRNCFFGERPKYMRCAEDIKKYLINNPTFPTRFAADEMSSTKIEALLDLKQQLEAISPKMDSFLLTSGVRSGKFEMCTRYTPRERRASSVSGDEEEVPSAVLLLVRQQDRDRFVILNGKRLEVKCVRSKSVAAELRYMLDYDSHKPGFMDSTTMTSPAMPETIEPIPVHGQSIDKTPPPPGRPDYSDQNSDNKTNDFHGNYNLADAMSNSLPKVDHLTIDNSQMITRRHSNGLYAGGPHQAVSMNGHSDSSSGYQVVTNGHNRHSSLNGHLNELRQTEPANGALPKPRRLLPVSVVTTRRNNYVAKKGH